MQSKLVFMLSIACFVLFGSCSNAQKVQSKMFATSQKLISYLLKSDTSKIYQLFAENDYRENRKLEVPEDCAILKKVTDKYGVPSQSDMQLSKGKAGENIVSVVLMDNPDSVLKLKKCVLFVSFYPDKFLSNANKILDYGIVMEPLHKPKQKLIIAPPIFKNH